MSPRSAENIAPAYANALAERGLRMPAAVEPDDALDRGQSDEADGQPVPVDDDTRRRRLEALARELLDLVDPDPTRPGLADTPRRWAQWWMERLDGQRHEAQPDTVFDRDDVGQLHRIDQVVVVSGIRVWSLCEHHLLPFWCDVTVGYRADQHVLGLSKFARVAHRYAARLQVQERLVQDIRAHLVRVVRTEDVAVIATGEHLCMTMRGAKTPARMTSSAIGGVFKHNDAARAELLALARA